MPDMVPVVADCSGSGMGSAEAVGTGPLIAGVSRGATGGVL